MNGSPKDTNAQGKQTVLEQENRKKSEAVNAAKKVLRDWTKNE